MPDKRVDKRPRSTRSGKNAKSGKLRELPPARKLRSKDKNHGADTSNNPQPGLLPAEDHSFNWLLAKHVGGLGRPKLERLRTFLDLLSLERWRHAKRVRQSGLFDKEYYTSANSLSGGRMARSLLHYVYVGSRGLLNPNEFFDTKYYLRNNPDVLAAEADPLLHYSQFGWKEGRRPSESFDPQWYLSRYPDVARAGVEPLHHYLTSGKLEGREPSRNVGVVRLRSTQLNGQEKKEQHANLGTHAMLGPARFAVGVVTYNNDEEELRRCMRSLEVASKGLAKGSKFQIVMIDNGKPASATLVKKFKIDRLPAMGNIGFGAAHNVLMSKAFETGAEYYLAVNPDGMLAPNALRALLKMTEAQAGKALIEAIQFPQEHPKFYDRVKFDTPWASGSCLLIPRRVFQSIGGFDRSFFMYCEDVDFSWRARSAGFKVKICPNALFYHPVDSRGFDATVHKRFLTSGIILARKWGSQKFEQSLLKEARNHQLNIEDIESPAVIADNAVVDFSHNFTFAEARW
jgi:GT2 family glycosyltransferase